VRILALDQASYICGWATFVDGKLTRSGMYEETDKTNVIKRLSGISGAVFKKIQTFKPDLVVIENIQLQFGNVTAYLPLAMLRGILLVHCYNKDVATDVYGTSTWRSYHGIKGKRDVAKKLAIELVKKKYNKTLPEDQAEAILIGEYAISKEKK